MGYMSRIKYDALRKAPSDPKGYLRAMMQKLAVEGNTGRSKEVANTIQNWSMVPPWE